MKRIRTAAAVCAAAALALTACTGDPNDVGDGGGDGGGTVDMQIGEVPTLVVSDCDDSECYRIVKNIYDGLVYYDNETGEPINLVAEAITSEDNQTWTITIKEGLQFQNGEPVDAEAFIRSWNNTAYGPNVAGLNYFFGRFQGYAEMNPAPLPEDQWADPEVPEFPEPEADTLSGVTAIDDLTIEVKLTQQFSGFATMLGYAAFLPMAEECLADLEACMWNPIGNGPFMLEGEYDPEAGASAVRWEDYEGGMPAKIDKVNWHPYLGESDCWNDFKTGDIDVCSPRAADFETAMADPELTERLVSQPGTTFTALGFPLWMEEWQDVNLRRAFSTAIDREAVLTVIGQARGVPADGFIPESIFGGGTGSCEYCEYDPEEAKRLLEEAGGWPEGEVFELWYNESADNQTLFRAVGDSIKETLGIEYELVPLDWPEFLTARDEHTVEGPFRYAWGPDYNLNENFLTPVYGGGEAMNVFGYASPEFDAAILAADQAPTLEEAVPLYAEAEKLIADAMPAAPVLYSSDNVFYSEDVENVVLNPIYVAPGGDCELREITVVQ
ncbi:ABC transporter substrate-binding protein [Glycomyces sp. YM15]|uniref:peptide ABC transporter substrate-binding protein n=1 Tax=Glycomyces sp. YM15 TaxID=2800446 RepID=UPI00196364F8|nr:ABC transporter substrate-binding protein [Glycomyces sp. YM15]